MEGEEEGNWRGQGKRKLSMVRIIAQIFYLSKGKFGGFVDDALSSLAQLRGAD
jgi:hypothetical protein